MEFCCNFDVVLMKERGINFYRDFYVHIIVWISCSNKIWWNELKFCLRIFFVVYFKVQILVIWNNHESGVLMNIELGVFKVRVEIMNVCILWCKYVVTIVWNNFIGIIFHFYHSFSSSKGVSLSFVNTISTSPMQHWIDLPYLHDLSLHTSFWFHVSFEI